ncbi:hypothetical protein FIBSPDRAFT_698724, partial [Athelia psychrophila]
IGGVAKRYFSTWKAKYKEQVDPVQAAKRVQKDKDGRTRDHRTAKWDRRRGHTAEFDQIHGTKG